VPPGDPSRIIRITRTPLKVAAVILDVSHSGYGYGDAAKRPWYVAHALPQTS
jgi:hypothetical protein